MAGHVGKYAYINAKLRARLSTMLPEDFFDRMEGAFSLADALTLLKDTPYSNLASVFDKTGDIKAVELELFADEIALYGEIRRQSDETVADMITAFELRYEVIVLKRALRLWFDRVVRERPIEENLSYLYRRPICYPIDIDALIAAGSISEISSLLKKTPYHEIVETAGREVEAKRTLFPLETALDRFYFSRLLSVFEQLDRQDRDIASRLIGVQIDIENINRLVRFKEAYRLPFEQILPDLIPHGHRLSNKIIETLVAAPDTGAQITQILGADYPELSAMMTGTKASSPLPARLFLIERVLEEVLSIEIRRVLGGYPFTIGIVIAYFLLAQTESRRIRSILNAKFYGRRQRTGAV
ncbi:MAG TPA: V-type ATPase subunit [Spirochaetia bacterium]|nr:V-type ATPase subunit [Spirochaetia bacterium]